MRTSPPREQRDGTPDHADAVERAEPQESKDHLGEAVTRADDILGGIDRRVLSEIRAHFDGGYKSDQVREYKGRGGWLCCDVDTLGGLHSRFFSALNRFVESLRSQEIDRELGSI